MDKEEIEKAKKVCRLLCGKKNKKGKREYETFTRLQMQIDYTVDEMAEAIETLLQYIQELEEIKEMKETIELAGMDIKSLLKFKYENERLKNKVNQLEQENNNEPLDDIYYPDILASPKRNGEHIKFALVEQEYFEELKNTVDKQNKIIDEMAKWLIGFTFSDKEETEVIFCDKEQVKQYFEKKVEEK